MAGNALRRMIVFFGTIALMAVGEGAGGSDVLVAGICLMGVALVLGYSYRPAGGRHG